MEFEIEIINFEAQLSLFVFILSQLCVILICENFTSNTILVIAS